ncbi:MULTISPECIES: hypothetical protein [unclassified Streptomyces]|uniref:hypothetical protein n=1 Tax=unclassified Streptomyces TaxID=2593676 RepID=UPI002DDC86DA|nr:hypothetical protein [Streptomyces sp. NBC_01766]WSC24897.1 hypothetical protein OIE60_35090 [Streptomyces sp. NBC_01766]
MTLTQLASVPDRQPIARRATAGELEQLTPAYLRMLSDAADLSAPDVSRYKMLSSEHGSAVRAAFRVGWIYGVRGGHTGPALQGVPLPGSSLRTALEVAQRGVSAASGEDGPRVLQSAEYHGSLTRHHGVYWVTRRDEVAERDGRTTVKFEISHWTGLRFQVVATQVNRESLTALPEFFRR